MFNTLNKKNVAARLFAGAAFFSLLFVWSSVLNTNVAHAAGYSISQTGSSTINSPAVTISGVAAANPFTGNGTSSQFLSIDWGEDGNATMDCPKNPNGVLNFTNVDLQNKTFQATWVASHTYPISTTTKTYNVFVRVHHSQCPGAESADEGGTIQVVIVIPPPTMGNLTVVKSVSGGPLTAGNFNIHVKSGTTDVAGSPAVGSSTGRTYTLTAGSYAVSEDTAPHYTGNFSACGTSGTVSVVASTTVTCTITNTFFNNVPVAQNGTLVTNEDTASSSAVSATDSDADALLYSIVTNPSHGTISGFNTTTGAFTYTPNANYNGPDSFTFSAADAYSSSNTGTVTITVNAVNDAPVATADSYSTSQDVPLNTPAAGVLVNDSDIDSVSLTAVLVSGSSNGTTTLNADGSFTYTPNTGYVGSDSFTYKANDGSLDSNTVTVSLSVSNVNDTPVAHADSYNTNEDVALAITAPGVLLNDTDADNDPLTAVLVSGSSHGTTTLNADGSFTYTPAADYNGPDSFTYKANDGTVDSSDVTVSITVTPVNDAPVSSGQSITTLMNTGTSSVLGATDVDGNTLTFATTTSPVNGTITFFDPATGAFTYAPALNYFGSDTFDFKANDGAADSNTSTVSITVSQTFENTLTLCSDGIDNDNDTLIDLADSDCAAFIPQLTVIKHVVNDNSGTNVASDFTMQVTGTNVSSSSFPGSETGVTVTLGPATYSVDEAVLSGYTKSLSADCSGTMAIGDNKTCTITNDDNAPVVTPPPSGGGGGGGGGGTVSVPSSGGGVGGPVFPAVLGAATTQAPQGQVLGAEVSCGPYLLTYIKYGKKNNVEDVKRLQIFLNKEFPAANISVTGFYGPQTKSYVDKFQVKYGKDVLAPWMPYGQKDDKTPTSYVYKTTKRQINNLSCPSLNLPIPQLP